MDEENEEETFFMKNIGWIITIAIVIVFSGYIAFGWFFSDPMRDCDYMNMGCQGENNKFGQ